MQTEETIRIRELAESLLSFGWAMSLFGANQLVNLLNPKRAEASFNAVTQVARDQVGEVLRPAFQIGDHLQRTAIDVMFRTVSLGTSGPIHFVTSRSDAMSKSAKTMWQSMPTDTPNEVRVQGWGPVD
jgi:hypothetical protein